MGQLFILVARVCRVMLALAMLGWLVWSWSTGRAVERGQVALIAAGLATDASSADARMGTLPDADNGALLIDRLALLVQTESAAWKATSSSQLLLDEADTQFARTEAEEVALRQQATRVRLLSAGIDAAEADRMAAEQQRAPEHLRTPWHAAVLPERHGQGGGVQRRRCGRDSRR